jgi:hypothetical protein
MLRASPPSTIRAAVRLPAIRVKLSAQKCDQRFRVGETALFSRLHVFQAKAPLARLAGVL